MSKKKKTGAPANSRDAPAKDSGFSGAWLCSPDAYRILCGDGYRPLSSCPEVMMCVDAYADLISSMTLHLMKNGPEGDVRIKNALSRKIDIEPYTLMTRKTWMYNIVNTLLLAGDGNQITYPVYDKNGYIENLIPLKPSSWSIIDTEDGSYYVRYGDKLLRPDEVLHFVLKPDPERPWKGTGFRLALQDVVKSLRQATATKRALMESPAPSIIVKVDGLTEEFASTEGRRRLAEQYLSSSDNGQPWFIPSEAFSVEQVKPLTLNDLAIAKNMELDKRTIAGLLGVPPYMVGIGEYDKAAFNGFITTKLRGLAQTIEQELTRKTLYAEDLYWRFNARSMYAYDLNEIINAGAQMTDRMAMRRNEWRDWIGMSPDEEMTELLALENYIPADRLGSQKKLVGGGETNE